MTERFTELTVRDHGRYRTVAPEVVVEIAFDRLMRSSRHRSGFALRFPRIVRIREDKRHGESTRLRRWRPSSPSRHRKDPARHRARGETERIAATGDGATAS